MILIKKRQNLNQVKWPYKNLLLVLPPPPQPQLSSPFLDPYYYKIHKCTKKNNNNCQNNQNQKNLDEILRNYKLCYAPPNWSNCILGRRLRHLTMKYGKIASLQVKICLPHLSFLCFLLKELLKKCFVTVLFYLI